MSAKKNLTGLIVGRLTAMRPVYTERGYRWECLCECGKTVFLPTAKLTGKRKTFSCGCLWVSLVGSWQRTHGQTETDLYRIWTGIKTRCYNAKSRGYRHYGKRGIRMSKEWKTSFVTFANDMGPRPAGSSIERIDNTKGYCKENCRWATSHEQARNRRSNRLLTLHGKTQSITDWAHELGLNPDTIRDRLMRRGWTVERALLTPSRKSPRVYD